MPERPSTAHLDYLRGLAGNEQLAEILKQCDTFEKQIEEWTARAELSARRKPAWEMLCALMKHAANLPAAKELLKQVEAVESERRLLEKTDPVPGIHKSAVTALRSAIKKAHDAFVNAYNREMEALSSSAGWKELKKNQQIGILDNEGISGIPSLSMGDDAALLSSLEETPLASWKIKIDALPRQFANAALAAARLLEPGTQNVQLKSDTLNTVDDVKTWLAETEKTLMEKLKKGPIVIS